jgi:three-Cys-motif partner protein
VPARKTEWVTAPDGLDARVVGRWVKRKVHHVDRFGSIFGTAMKNKWASRGYVELFAGPGLSKIRGTSEFIVGSARRAIGSDFTHYAFVDLDPRATRALDARLRNDGVAPNDGVGKNYQVLTGDCNLMVSNVRKYLPSGSLSLVFIDPTAFQIEMHSVIELVKDRRMDLLLTFQVAALIRVAALVRADRIKSPAVDAFFGTPDWRDVLAGSRQGLPGRLIDFYNLQLTERAGYQPGAYKNAVPVKNSKNVTIYDLVLFSKHPLGAKFWTEAARINELGQNSLWEGWDPA